MTWSFSYDILQWKHKHYLLACWSEKVSHHHKDTCLYLLHFSSANNCHFTQHKSMPNSLPAHTDIWQCWLFDSLIASQKHCTAWLFDPLSWGMRSFSSGSSMSTGELQVTPCLLVNAKLLSCLLENDKSLHVYWWTTSHFMSTGERQVTSCLLESDKSLHVFWWTTSHFMSTGDWQVTSCL